jgi:hypothetical protein
VEPAPEIVVDAELEELPVVFVELPQAATQSAIKAQLNSAPDFFVVTRSPGLALRPDR